MTQTQSLKPWSTRAEIIEHLLDPDLLLSEINRALSPGGRRC